jgi:hypothetical protein
MPSIAFRTILTGLSSSSGFPTWFPDTAVRPFSVGIGCVVNSSAATYNVEHSFDYTGSSAFISSNATWFSSAISAATSNAFGSYAFPISALRLNVTAGSSTGTVSATFIQAG